MTDTDMSICIGSLPAQVFHEVTTGELLRLVLSFDPPCECACRALKYVDAIFVARRVAAVKAWARAGLGEED